MKGKYYKNYSQKGMKIIINKRQLIFIQLIITFIITIQPKLFTQYKVTVLLYAIGNLIVFSYYFLKVIRDGRISKYLFAWICLRTYYLIIMFVNGNIADIDQWGYLTLMVANYILVIEWCCKNNYMEEMITALAMVCLIYLMINAASLVTFDNGIISARAKYDNGDGDYYFLGIKTAYTSYIFTALVACGICFIEYNRRMLCYLIVTFSVFNIIYANISTGIVCLVTLLLLIIFKKIFKIEITLNFIIIVAIIINIAFVLFNAQYIFSDIIVNALHKQITLTGRTDIWHNAIIQMKNQSFTKLLLGNGIYNGGSFVKFGAGLWPAHNQWIQNIFEYGIFGTMALLLFLRYSMKTKYAKLKIEKYILDVIFVMLIGTITMHYLGYAHVYLLFIILRYAGEFEKNIKGRRMDYVGIK